MGRHRARRTRLGRYGDNCRGCWRCLVPSARRAPGSANNKLKGGVEMAAFCVRNLPRRRSNTPSSRWRCYRSCWRSRDFGVPAPDGRLAALVERAASHGVARRRLSTPKVAAKDIALYDAAREDRGAVYGRGRFCCRRFLTLILPALQPVCLLYTRAVMEGLLPPRPARPTPRRRRRTTILRSSPAADLPQCPTFRSFMPAGRCRGISSLAGPVRVASRPCPFPARSSRCLVIGAFAQVAV